MDYNINIKTLEIDKSDQAVYNIHYTIFKEVDSEIKEITCCQRHLSKDPENFIPFESLTESNVLSWITVSEGDLEKLQKLVEDFSNQKTFIKTPPWVAI